MNRNGTPAIILIYLMVTLPVFMDGKGQSLADATLTSARENLYSTFQDRLNASSNFAQSEYDSENSEVVGRIYDLVGRILTQQLKQQPTDNSQNDNYADKLVDEADPSRSHDIFPPAVASTATNTAAEAAKKYTELINAKVAGSDVNQLDHRQARKIRKASRRFCPRPRVKKSYYTETSVARRQSSRPKWANRRIQPSSLSSLSMPVGGGNGAEEWQGSAGNTNDDWRCRRSSNAVDDVSNSETNELAESIGSGNSSNRHGLPSDKWRRKFKIDGRRKKNLRNCRSWPNLLEDESNEIIESDDKVGKDEAEGKRRRRRRNDYGPQVDPHVTDPFPEVFARPLVDGSPLPNIAAAAQLNEALKTAMLAPDTNIPSSRAPTNPEDPGAHIGKQIPSFEMSSLEGSKLGAPPPAKTCGAASLTCVMEKVLGELESLKQSKGDNSTQAPEGSPCDVVGTWNSEIIGLQFHLSIADLTPTSRSFVEGRKMELDVTEKVPPRRHDLMDCDWYFTANTLKQFGGPFYITAHKAEKYTVATFVGLCKTCGGVPTVFGSWTFVYPAKDCQDVSLAVETKRDIFRKDNLDAKRKHRLSVTSKGQTSACSHK